MVPVHIHLSKPSGKLPAGSSRFWGNPDLPHGHAYPEYEDDDGDMCPYFFVCQINMKEVAPFDIEGLLPHDGLLSFFAKIDSYLGYYADETYIGGTICGSEDVKVLYFPSCENLEEMSVVDEDGNPGFPGPLRASFSLEHEPLSDDHALLALPEHRQWENWDHPFEDWMILLQVDSFEGEDFRLDFMDVGVLDFLISPMDLKHLRFDDVRAVVLSS